MLPRLSRQLARHATRHLARVVPNVPAPTLGGMQFWNDCHITTGGWRVQQHCLTEHHRLLTPSDVRRAWGSYDECRLAIPPREKNLAAGETVLCVHGLGRSRSSMEPMAAFLREAGYRVLSVGYASTRTTVDEQARIVVEILHNGPPLEKVHWVGHSLGCLIARRYEALARQHEGITPLGRVVMLAPPNQGSRLADRMAGQLGASLLFRVVDGPAGQEIVAWDELEPTLATPSDFGVIAGRFDPVSNPLLNEPSDLVVTVEETKLAGQSDFATVAHSHTLIMRRRDVMTMTRQFLQSGRFAEQPAEAAQVAP